MFFSFMSSFILDGTTIISNGFFYGWSINTVILMFAHAFGGICVALVMTYADNIVKSFSLGMSIVLTTIVSYYVFGTVIDSSFFVGSLFVIVSIADYNDKFNKV